MKQLVAFVLLSLLATTAHALDLHQSGPKIRPSEVPVSPASYTDEQDLEEWNPNAPDADAIMEEFIQENADQLEGLEWWNRKQGNEFSEFLHNIGGCYRESCTVYLYISIAHQRLDLYLNGKFRGSTPISSGRLGPTRRWDGHPNGPIYPGKYSSRKYPGGNYVLGKKRLGNMPYAMFYSGGFAVHGTPQGNWKHLGRPASHGCVRIHPEDAFTINQLVRQAGINKVWFTIQ